MRKLILMSFALMSTTLFSQSITESKVKYTNNNFDIKFSNAIFDSKQQTLAVEFIITNRNLPNQEFELYSRDLTFSMNPQSKAIDYEGNEYFPNSITIGSKKASEYDHYASNELVTEIPLKGKIIYKNIIKCNQIRLLSLDYKTRNISDKSNSFSGRISVEDFKPVCK